MQSHAVWYVMSLLWSSADDKQKGSTPGAFSRAQRELCAEELIKAAHKLQFTPCRDDLQILMISISSARYGYYTMGLFARDATTVWAKIKLHGCHSI